MKGLGESRIQKGGDNRYPINPKPVNIRPVYDIDERTMMQKTKIEWCDYVWNPVWGCRNQCPYCYARKLAHRFGKSFEPHWVERNFQSPIPKEPSRIFVNSMSDIMFWKPEWWERVIARIRENPQHTFLFLSKSPMAYVFEDFPDNCWLGVTATTQREVALRLFEHTNLCFISIEPILGPINPDVLCRHDFSWVILGAETGNRKGRIIPPSEWIRPFLDLPIPLYMKDNLPWSGPWRREFPG